MSAQKRRERFVAYFNGALRGSREALIRRTGLSKGRVSQLFDPEQPFGEKAAASLAERLGLRSDFFESDHATASPNGGMEGATLQAQEMSPPRYRVLPTIRWEDLMTREELPDLFATPAPDDSMAPRVREGQLVTLERGLEPRGGDGVLVKDRDGHTYLRLYRPRRPGIWEAHALNPDYQSLDSERDGLVVLAVIVAVHARWS